MATRNSGERGTKPGWRKPRAGRRAPTQEEGSPRPGEAPRARCEIATNSARSRRQQIDANT
eukprot:5817426-Alexandrium_andersonii.AAC.1